MAVSSVARPFHTSLVRDRAAIDAGGETADLLRAARTAKPSERRRLYHRAVELNLSIARSLARRYSGRGVATEDLEQVANLGLVKAVQRFDPARGCNFRSYAVPTIRGEIRRYFRDVAWVVRPPRRVQQMQASIASARADLSQQLGRPPRPDEIAGAVEADVGEVTEALTADSCYSPTSLDAATDVSAEGSLIDRLGIEDTGFERSEARLVLAPAIQKLDRRDRRLIELRFFRGWSQSRIGAEIGVSQMQVSRRLTRVLTTLREAIVGAGGRGSVDSVLHLREELR